MQLKNFATSFLILAYLAILNWHPSMAQEPGKRSKNNTDPADTLSARYVKIEKIYIIGHDRTRKSIITRELSIVEGGIYEVSTLTATLELDEQKIFNTRLFNSVDVSLLETTQGIGSVLVKVEERWYFFPAPIFKLADRNFNDWWTNRNRDLSRVNYGLRVDQFNLRGVNDRLRVVAQFGFTREFEASYRIPYVDRAQRHGFITGVKYNEWKNLPYVTEDHIPAFLRSDNLLQTQFSTYLTYSYRYSFYNFHYFTAGYQSAEVVDTVFQLNPNYFGNELTKQQFVNLSYMFVRDRRDFRNYPLKGHYITFVAEKSGLTNDADLNIWESKAQYSKYWDIGNGFYFSSSVTGLISGPSLQPYYFNQSLGYGRNYVRGYELDVVEGPNYILSKSSLKKEVFKTTKDISKFMAIPQFQKMPIALYAKLFFDGGYVQNYPNYQMNTRLSNKPIYGLGTGLDLVSYYDFVVKTEFSLNSQGDFHVFLNFRADF